MSLSFTVGGARATFDPGIAGAVADVIEGAFGAEGDWEGVEPRHFGDLAARGSWEAFQDRAAVELGIADLPNILAIGGDGRGVYLPAHLRAITLRLPDGAPLCCASLPGLRDELETLAARWDLPLDDDGLRAVLRVVSDPDDGYVAEPPELLTFARLALAANEATRRDCPLWLVGEN